MVIQPISANVPSGAALTIIITTSSMAIIFFRNFFTASQPHFR